MEIVLLNVLIYVITAKKNVLEQIVIGYAVIMIQIVVWNGVHQIVVHQEKLVVMENASVLVPWI